MELVARTGGPSREGRGRSMLPEEKACTLCKKLGRTRESYLHELTDCYCNPRSTKFKDWVWRLRASELRLAGKPLPEEMQWDDEKAAQKAPQEGTSAASRVAKAKADVIALMKDRQMSFADAFEVSLMANVAPVMQEEEDREVRGTYFARDFEGSSDDENSVDTSPCENGDL